MESPEKEVRWAKLTRRDLECIVFFRAAYLTRLGESGAPSVGRDQDWGG